jgi:hypothetical protein
MHIRNSSNPYITNYTVREHKKRNKGTNHKYRSILNIALDIHSQDKQLRKHGKRLYHKDYPLWSLIMYNDYNFNPAQYK